MIEAICDLQFVLDLRNRREDLASEIVSLLDGLLQGEVAVATAITFALIVIQIALTLRGLR